MLIEFLHEVTGYAAVFARIELTRLLGQHLTHSSGEGETRVGVDIDLANSALRSLAQLLLRYTYCIGQLAAECVDGINLVLGNL